MTFKILSMDASPVCICVGLCGVFVCVCVFLERIQNDWLDEITDIVQFSCPCINASIHTCTVNVTEFISATHDSTNAEFIPKPLLFAALQ